MKNYLKLFMSLAVLVMMSVTSCVEDGLRENPADEGCKEIPALSEQVKAIEMSLSDLSALEAALDNESEMENVIESVESHISALRSGMPWGEGTVATMEQQKKLAHAVGAIKASHNGNQSVEAAIKSLEASAKVWLGKNLDALYPIAAAQAETDAVIAGLNLGMQKIKVDGIASDLEAGLRKGASLEDVAALAASVEKNISESEKLSFSIAKMVSDVEDTYRLAIQSVVENPSNFKSSEVKSVNKSAAAMLKSSETNLQGLISRVEICESSLEDLAAKVGELEADIQDLEGLLNMIQSVTFMSEYSEENAIAYYTLGSESRADGKKVRNHQGTIDLRYVIRPASAAQALTVSDLWDNGVKVFGYYAKAITKATPETFDFDITNVTADEAGNGIVTVTISAASLNENFYFKETGAKLALSIATGKTDLTSKFVEIVPKDASGTVYVESIELSAKSIEIDNGTKANLEAYITPDNVTVGGVTWTTSDANVVNVNENGVIEGMSVGQAVITATTKGTDEWGNTIQAQCNVKVNPAIKLSGPSYVEKGSKITIRIESPDYIDPESVTWKSSAPTLASITKSEDGSAVISGDAMYFSTTDKAYTPITITCDIEDKATLYHEIRVIAVQPKGVAIEGLASGQNALTLKKGQEYTFNSTVQPAEVDMTLFRFRYQSNNTEVVNVPDINSGYVVANTIGSATVSVKVTDQGQYNYFYPVRNEYVRYVDVTVEPYYVETVTIDSPVQLSPGADPVILPVTFTSDVEGKDPTFTGVKWSMSAEDAAKGVISLDSDTGKITPLAEGNVTVTATTYEDGAVPSGSAHKSGQCVVIVKTQQNPVVVGGYYYSDGTWGTEAQPSGKSVIGVIFSTASAVLGDSMLSSDGYSACVNGLAVSTVEYTSKFGYIATGSVSAGQWFINNGYDNINTTKPNGYSNTKGLIAYDTEKDPNHTNVSEAVAQIPAKHTATVSSPEGASTWYIPSYYEMSLLYQNMSDVNSALSAVSGAQISASDYWSSSLQWTDDKWNDILKLYPFSMQSGGWAAAAEKTTQLPVRIVLAF